MGTSIGRRRWDYFLVVCLFLVGVVGKCRGCSKWSFLLYWSIFICHCTLRKIYVIPDGIECIGCKPSFF